MGVPSKDEGWLARVVHFVTVALAMAMAMVKTKLMIGKRGSDASRLKENRRPDR